MFVAGAVFAFVASTVWQITSSAMKREHVTNKKRDSNLSTWTFISRPWISSLWCLQRWCLPGGIPRPQNSYHYPSLFNLRDNAALSFAKLLLGTVVITQFLWKAVSKQYIAMNVHAQAQWNVWMRSGQSLWFEQLGLVIQTSCSTQRCQTNWACILKGCS